MALVMAFKAEESPRVLFYTPSCSDNSKITVKVDSIHISMTSRSFQKLGQRFSDYETYGDQINILHVHAKETISFIL